MKTLWLFVFITGCLSKRPASLQETASHTNQTAKSLRQIVAETTWYLPKTADVRLLRRLRDPYILKIGEEATTDTTLLKQRVQQRLVNQKPMPPIIFRTGKEGDMTRSDSVVIAGIESTLAQIYVTLGWYAESESIRVGLWRNVFLEKYSKIEEFNRKNAWWDGQWQMVSFAIPWEDGDVTRRLIFRRLAEIAGLDSTEIGTKAAALRHQIDSLWIVFFEEQSRTATEWKPFGERLRTAMGDSAAEAKILKEYQRIRTKSTVGERTFVPLYLEAYRLDGLAMANGL